MIQKSNIAILGTRGIPNRYGGFERFAEVLACELAQSGFVMYVLKPTGNRKENTILYQRGVYVVPIYTNPLLPKNLQTVIYDFKSLLWFAQGKCSIALECGHSFSFWLPFFSASVKRRIVINMDGLEHKREKWNFFGKTFLQITEKLAVKSSCGIICDHPEIAEYIHNKYNRFTEYIPYGAYLPGKPNTSGQINKYNLVENDYCLVIARITPENNLEMVCKCFIKNDYTLAIVGNISGKYAEQLQKRFNKKNIRFLGDIYEQDTLNALRSLCKYYIHGHSVGGTNPSLLEAMACGCRIIAHDNPFNRYVLDENALFFRDQSELTEIINHKSISTPDWEIFSKKNIQRLGNEYNWAIVTDMYKVQILKMISEQVVNT